MDVNFESRVQRDSTCFQGRVRNILMAGRWREK